VSLKSLRVNNEQYNCNIDKRAIDTCRQLPFKSINAFKTVDKINKITRMNADICSE